MQLTPTGRPSSIRGRLSAAACVLLATGAPTLAGADSAATNQFEATGLIYGEANRANVVEPTARITRLLPNGQTLSAQLGIDVITGASPTGGMPSGRVTTGPAQTTTGASGGGDDSKPPGPGDIPLARFRDARAALDGEWTAPLGLTTTTLGGHFSREKDYQSAGASGKLSIDLMRRLTTLTVGGGYNHDDVFPTGGIRVPLSDGTARTGTGTERKRVTTVLAGVSRVLTRRWMVGVNASRMIEQGYLTDPYKVVSLIQPDSGVTVVSVTEKRPPTRDRRDVLASSVYHLTSDVLYLSYRYYWDDWKVRSHTIDVRYRRELGNENFLEPHVRFYAQTAAGFFHYGLLAGTPLPDLVTSDDRLGALRSVTLGATYGFRVPDTPGEWSVRAEYIGQFGNGHPRDVVGLQRQYDLFPTVNIGSLVVGYSVGF